MATLTALIFLARPAPVAESVDALIARAVAANPAVLIAKQRVAESASHLAEMEGRRKLQLALGGAASVSSGQVAQPVSTQSFATFEADLLAPIPDFARANAEVAGAAANLEATRAQYRRVVLGVVFRTATAAFELLRADDAAAIAQQDLDQSLRQEQDTKLRIQHGDLPPADLLKAQVPVAQNRAALARAKSAQVAARESLNDMVQRDLGAEIAVSPSPASRGPSPDVAAAVGLAMAHDPDVLEAKANVQAAAAAERIARRGRDPNFALQLSHVRTGDPTAYAYMTTLGLTVSLPLADGGVVRQQVRQARLQAQQAATALKLVEQRVRLDVQQAVLAVETDRANVDATNQTAAIASESLAKSRQAYAAGLTTTRDVLDAQLILSQALIDASSAHYDLAIAEASLKQLIGTEVK